MRAEIKVNKLDNYIYADSLQQTKPMLSFCIPTYNRAKRVLKCVEHILKYPGDEIEVVVSDNASTDNTQLLLKSINDNRLKIFCNKEDIHSLNWPLVVSKASGRFAALMSDEDIVCLEDLPYFLDLLEKADADDIGAIIYRFPPMCMLNNEYVTEDVREAFKIASSSGHITAHILNMRFFIYKDNSGYEQGSLDNPHSEPQQEILLDIAKKQNIMTTGKSLCCIGVEELFSDAAKTTILNVLLEGRYVLSYYMQEVIFTARANMILEEFPSDSNETFGVLCDSVVRSMICIALYSAAITRGAPNSRDQYAFEEAVKHFGYSRSDVIDMMIKTYDYMTDYCDTYWKRPCWKHYQSMFKDMFNQRYDRPVPNGLSEIEKIAIGDTFYRTHQCFYDYFWFCADRTRIKYGYPDDYEDLLETKKTSEIYTLLMSGKYDSVINYPDVKTFRAYYLRAQAYFHKDELYKACDCFEMFLSTVQNPRCLGDIITGMKAVQYSYYYLGEIYRKMGNLNKAVRYYSKCNELTDKMLLGYDLNSKSLCL